VELPPREVPNRVTVIADTVWHFLKIRQAGVGGFPARQTAWPICGDPLYRAEVDAESKRRRPLKHHDVGAETWSSTRCGGYRPRLGTGGCEIKKTSESIYLCHRGLWIFEEFSFDLYAIL